VRGIGEGDPFAVVRRLTPRGMMHELCSLRGEPLEPSTHSRVDVRGHVFSVGTFAFLLAVRTVTHRRCCSTLVLELARARSPMTTSPDLFSGVGLFSVPLAKVVGPGDE